MKDHMWEFVWYSRHARIPGFSRNLDPPRMIRSPYCTKICSNALSKFCDNGLGITSDNETVSSKQGNLSDIELSPWILPRRRFFRQKISISGNRRPLHSKMGHVRMLKPLWNRCVVLRRDCMAPAMAICPNCREINILIPYKKSANSLTQPPGTPRIATDPPRLSEHLRNFSSMSHHKSCLGEDGVQQRQSDTNCLILTTFP